MQEKSFEVRTFMPLYGMINERRNQLHEVIRLSGMNIVIDDTDHPLIIKVATLQPSRMQVYFIDNDDYFHTHGSAALETAASPEDNDERAIFFNRGVLETVKKLRWDAAIIHCSGWISAFAPLYIKKIYADDPAFAKAKVITSLFGPETAFEGTLDARMAEKLKFDGVDADALKSLTENPADYKALMRLAMDYSDAIIAAQEDVDPELIEYARNTGKPFMPYPGKEDFTQAYYNFYRTLLGVE